MCFNYYLSGVSMVKLPECQLFAGHSLGKRHMDGWLIPPV